MRGRLWLTLVVAAGIAAIVAFAVLDAVRREPAPERGGAAVDREPDPEPPRLSGPDVPAPGVLPGRLVLLTERDCRIRVLDLATLTPSAEGPRTSCRIWPSPRGDLVAFELASDTGPTLWLATTDTVPVVRVALGAAASPPAWGPDGDRVALCRPGGETVVLDLDGQVLDRIEGCHPRFAPDGTVVTRPAASGETPTVGRPRVVGHDVGEDGTVTLALLRSESALRLYLTLELRVDGRQQRILTMPQYGPTAGFYGLRVMLGPGGREVAVTTPDVLSPSRPDDLVALLDLRTERALDGFTTRRYRGLAWSPDGVWLAFSTGDEVLVYGPARADPVYVLPLRAEAIGWLSPQRRAGTGLPRRRRGARPRPRRRGAGAGARR